MSQQHATYYRVSTQKQGKSGLGLEAQRSAVLAYLAGKSQRVREFVEIETGTAKRERPVLAQALDHCRLTGALLVVAKVDRLTRSVAFLHRVLESGVDVRFCDLPHLEGATGRFMLTQMAAVAELEAGMISQRTKAALEMAKTRGVKLGNPNGAAALKRYGTGHAHGVVAIQAKAQARARSLAGVVAELAPGRSLRQLADALNERRIKTPRRGSWYAASVSRLLDRLV